MPSIFDFPPHLQPKKPCNRSSRDLNSNIASTSTIASEDIPLECVPGTEDKNIEDFNLNENYQIQENESSIYIDGQINVKQIKNIMITVECPSCNVVHIQDSNGNCISNNNDITEKLVKKVDKQSKQLKHAVRKIKTLGQTKARLRKRNAALKNVLRDLRKKDLVGDSSLNVLENCAGGIQDLLKRCSAKQILSKSPKSYSPELRTFALTLHFYSPKAYSYVRKSFDTCLPHPQTIKKWYNLVPGEPGISSEALNAAHVKAVSSPDGKPIPCALIMDEMALRQHTEFDGNRYHGFIDMGTEIDGDNLPVAKEALCFMIVPLKGHWKLPVAYYLIDGLAAAERKNLINDLIEKLHTVKINIVSLTFDGTSTNISMAQKLGCDFDPEKIVTSFPHPLSKLPIHVFLDPCHMLKLVRNTLGDIKVLEDEDGNMVKWEFIERLQNVQEKEGLHLGNKLRLKHIQWKKKKMNVKLAAQLLSESVAKSLTFCLKGKIDSFEGCEGTIKFIEIFNKLFDILNSRNLFANGWSRPFQPPRENEYFKFMEEARQYILSLKIFDPHSKSLNSKKNDGNDEIDRSILKSKRKTGFLGFLICINSLKELYREMVTNSKTLDFLLTYKLSQDHIELFFGQIRSMGGCNNNPTARQFKSAFKRLLVKNEIDQVTKGNAFPIEAVPILFASSGKQKGIPSSVCQINSSLSRSRMMEEDLPNEDNTETIDDYEVLNDRLEFSLTSQNIIAYIAGFVVFKLKKNLKCEPCIKSLECLNKNETHELIILKSKGKLIIPSDNVFNICLTCEKIYRENIAQSRGNISSITKYKIVSKVLETYASKDIFTDLDQHVKNFTPLENHIVFLIKAIAEKYIQTRCHYAGKEFTANMMRNKVISRSKNNKLVIFSGL